MPARIGAFSFASPTQGFDGIDADPATGRLRAIGGDEQRTNTLDVLTGAAAVQATALTCDGVACGDFQRLAIAAAVPEPGSFALTAPGLPGLCWRRRRGADRGLGTRIDRR